MKWTVLQVMIDLLFFAGGLVVWAKLSRPQKDDPRLSKGLQLLQSKIAVLEDLSDRIDTQVRQVAILLEQKSREVQQSIQAAQDQIHRVDHSIQKSLDVSKIFQDKIPHKEIIERQNTIKYIQAARMAHQGMSADEIAQKVDIPRSELDFVVKVNRNKLMFSEEHLPEWAQETLNHEEAAQANPEAAHRDLSQVFESFKVTTAKDESLKKIEAAFKEAIEEVRVSAEPTPLENAIEQVTNKVETSLTNMANQIKDSVKEGVEIIKQGNKEMKIRPFIFKKFDDEDPEKKHEDLKMKEILPHMKINDKVWALIEEVLDQNILIVNFQGDLVRVNNESSRKFRPGQRIQLRVIAMNPMNFQLLNDRSEGTLHSRHIDINI